MPIVKIGTTPCPVALRVEFSEGARRDTMCPNVANVYQIISGSQYKCICSGSNPDTGDEVGPYHEQFFGPYYLDLVNLD